jgi:hypothetical protein
MERLGLSKNLLGGEKAFLGVFGIRWVIVRFVDDGKRQQCSGVTQDHQVQDVICLHCSECRRPYLNQGHKSSVYVLLDDDNYALIQARGEETSFGLRTK